MLEKYFAQTLYLPKLLVISSQSLVLIIQRSMPTYKDGHRKFEHDREDRIIYQS
jgi:hypothetical protein